MKRLVVLAKITPALLAFACANNQQLAAFPVEWSDANPDARPNPRRLAANDAPVRFPFFGMLQ
jgi:hypothetical protein